MENSQIYLGHFRTEDHLLGYAKWFVSERIETFRKDMAICLTPDPLGRHAYYPALMSCVSLMELLIALYDGDLNGKGFKRIENYANTFMGHMPDVVPKLALLWEMFRHKVAHVTQPYGVFSPDESKYAGKLIKAKGWTRVTWTVSEKPHYEAVAVVQEKGTLVERPPWSLKYEYRCTIGLPRLAREIVASAVGENGYLRSLPGNPTAQAKFADCMGKFFPPGDDSKPPSDSATLDPDPNAAARPEDSAP